MGGFGQFGLGGFGLTGGFARPTGLDPCGTFDGVGDKITTPFSIGTSSSYRFQFYFLKSSSTGHSAFDCRDAGGDGVLILIGSIVDVRHQAGVHQWSGTALNDSAWHYVDVQWDGATVSIAVDEGTPQTFSNSSSLNVSANTVMGMRSFGVDALQLDGRMARAIVTFGGVLQANYLINEGSGTNIGDSAGSNDGTLTTSDEDAFWANDFDP